MTWYYALGNERQGPIDDAALDRLIAAGTVTPDTLVWRAGMADWQPLAQARPRTTPVPIVPAPPAAITPTPAATTPDTQPRFAAPTPTATPVVTPTPAAGAYGSYGATGDAAGAAGAGAGWSQTGAASAETADQIYARVTGEHRTFGIGDAIGRGWELVSGNFGLAVGATAIWILCTAAGAIPCLGILISLGVTPILQAGLYRLFLNLHRGEPAEFGDAFSVFSTSYLQVFLYALVQAILIGICLVPGYALSMIGTILSQRNEAVGMLLSFIGVLLVFPPAVYLAVSWAFAPLLIIDKGLDFWPAMELSRKVVAKQFFGVLGLLFICGLIFLAGVVALCLGVFVAAPLALAVIAVAYDDLFGRA
jgi:hypothetical protein